jgi:hypothetical protein
MLALRVYVRDFEASDLAAELLEALEEVYIGPRLGTGVTIVELDDEDDDPPEDGGSLVPTK